MRFSGIHTTSQTVPLSLLPFVFQWTMVQLEHLPLLYCEAFPRVPCPLRTKGTDVTLLLVNAAGCVPRVVNSFALWLNPKSLAVSANLAPTSCFSSLFFLCPHYCRYTECFSVLVTHHGSVTLWTQAHAVYWLKLPAHSPRLQVLISNYPLALASRLLPFQTPSLIAWDGSLLRCCLSLAA